MLSDSLFETANTEYYFLLEAYCFVRADIETPNQSEILETQSYYTGINFTNFTFLSPSSLKFTTIWFKFKSVYIHEKFSNISSIKYAYMYAKPF